MTISKETGQAVAAEINEAVRAILAKHGLEAGKTVTGHGEWFEYKVTAVAVTLGDNGVNLSSKEATYYSKFGYTAYAGDDDFTGVELTAPLGTRFNAGRPLQDYAFAGIDAKKRKFPIMAIDLQTGKMVGFPDSVVSRINLAHSQAVIAQGGK